ncbi:MAG: molybdate ABC transporter substrate-binding protein [Paracoccus sp. (in: a-proteobacteria)]|nr:molybdate ABC transporter substrate-binding protein [Paracoccus sp. (in: a-proteobacteria)]
MRTPLLLAAVLGTTALPGLADQVNVFAAASMKNALDQVAADFSAETGHEVVISYAGSNALAKQIIDGAPADIFISANIPWMDEVENADMIAEGARRDLLGNRLVLVAHDATAPVEIGPGTDLSAMLRGGKLAMALIDSVPAGQYGKAALEHLGLWASVEGDVAQADNVRAALALVATGEAPLGIVYATDAQADPGVHLIGTFPDDSYPPAIYPAALLTGAADQADHDFFAYLSSDKADAVFQSEGFLILD